MAIAEGGGVCELREEGNRNGNWKMGTEVTQEKTHPYKPPFDTGAAGGGICHIFRPAQNFLKHLERLEHLNPVEALPVRTAGA